jgi:hypothetical protein
MEAAAVLFFVIGWTSIIRVSFIVTGVIMAPSEVPTRVRRA